MTFINFLSDGVSISKCGILSIFPEDVDDVKKRGKSVTSLFCLKDIIPAILLLSSLSPFHR